MTVITESLFRTLQKLECLDRNGEVDQVKLANLLMASDQKPDGLQFQAGIGRATIEKLCSLVGHVAIKPIMRKCNCCGGTGKMEDTKLYKIVDIRIKGGAQ